MVRFGGADVMAWLMSSWRMRGGRVRVVDTRLIMTLVRRRVKIGGAKSEVTSHCHVFYIFYSIASNNLL